MTRPATAASIALDTVRWSPPTAYPLALEVMRIAELRRRGSAEHFRRAQRVEFYSLIAVTSGATVHELDFVPTRAVAGTWLLQRPGQVQRHDLSRRWDGWLVVFRPDLLPPPERRRHAPLHDLQSALEGLPAALRLAPAAHAVACAAVAQMAADAQLAAGVAERNALMLHQLSALLLRLRLGHGEGLGAAPAAAIDRDRVARLQALIEAHFRTRHDGAWYAAQLACAPKTLSRACQAGTGKTPKALLVERIVLEAKRLLVHGQQPVQAIADQLGFDEASNFAKLFKREAGCTALAFRAQQGSPSSRR